MAEREWYVFTRFIGSFVFKLRSDAIEESYDAPNDIQTASSRVFQR